MGTNGGLVRIADFDASFPPDRQAPWEARRQVASACAHWPEEPREIALLLTSELVTNAVLHGLGEVLVGVRCRGARLRVEVGDEAGHDLALGNGADHEESGRGLRIVDSLADRWGVESRRDGTGKTVWFELSSDGF